MSRLKMAFFIIIAALVAVVRAQNDAVALQLQTYANATAGSVFPLTTSAGSPVSPEEANNTLNSNLQLNEYYLDVITHLSSENIPDRIVHTKAAGASGYFEVTKSFSKYSKAKLFETVGKRTPVSVRIGPGTGPKGTPDLGRAARGFSVKFYTEEGNWDLINLNLPMFLIKDPVRAHGFIHAFKPNSVSNLQDINAIWDWLSLNPETLFAFMYINSDKGIGANFRSFDAHSIHTIQLENANGKLYFARFHLIPENGTQYINATTAAAAESDAAVRDLYDNIAAGNFPAWIVKVQLLTHKQVKKVGSKVFDVTRILPEDQYPLREVGRLVLNKNPTNYFAEVEQLSFVPSNLVPGIAGGVDLLYEARRIAYRIARNYRLGINANNIPINAPLTPSNNYLRDGVPPVNTVNYDGPNYYPNSFNGPVPLGSKPLDLYTYEADTEDTNYDQASEFYTKMTTDEKTRMVNNIAGSLSIAQPFLQKRAISAFANINTTLSASIESTLAAIVAASA